MKKIFFILVSVLVLVSASKSERTLPYLVSTDWLAENLNNKDIIILQVGYSKKEFDFGGHIPNSRFLWVDWLINSTPDLSTEMPSVEKAKMVFEQLGIKQDSKIILIYQGSNITITTRMFLVFSYFGFNEQTSILNGGFETWKKEQREVSKTTSEIIKTNLNIKINSSVITDSDFIKSNLDNPEVKIVDARTKNFYDGNGGGVLRQGHIKGAKNIIYNSIIDSTFKLKSIEEMQKFFDDAGITKGSNIVSYCHVGQQATVIYFAAKILGYNAKVYEGSFEDWNVRDESYPVEK